MIVHLTGNLVHKAPTHVIIDVNGIGYEVRISLNTFTAIKEQKSCQLLIYQYIKGDLHALYGFASLEEKQSFLQLINVNSVGPRTALTILSSLSPKELWQVIGNQQVHTLKAIKGIGDKAAQRIVLELQNKMQQETVESATTEPGTGAIAREALAALIKLGITPAAAEKALDKVRQSHTGEASVELLIKKVLQGG